MAIPGELSGFEGVKCICGKHLSLKVCQSAAGYYLGYFCDECGPYSRETGYFRNYIDAQRLLDDYRNDAVFPQNTRH